MYHTKETNVYICSNIPVDAPRSEMEKIREARGSLEAMVSLGKYPPGEYIIHRKGLPVADRQAGHNSYTYGMTFEAAVRETAKRRADNRYNYGKLDPLLNHYCGLNPNLLNEICNESATRRAN